MNEYRFPGEEDKFQEDNVDTKNRRGWGDVLTWAILCREDKEQLDRIEALLSTPSIEDIVAVVEAMPDSIGLGKASDMVRLMTLHEVIEAIQAMDK